MTKLRISKLPTNVIENNKRFDRVSIAIIPYPALGDLTIYLRMAWHFHNAGAKVCFFSSSLYPARDYWSWLNIDTSESVSLVGVAEKFDLVLACYEVVHDELTAVSDSSFSNVAFVSAKKIPADLESNECRVVVLGEEFASASRAFCLDSKRGWTMVDWVDHYVKEVYHVVLADKEGFLQKDYVGADSGVIAIFPTTPQSRKNYWINGFIFLGWFLNKLGWKVEFICTPNEYQGLSVLSSKFPVRAFPDLRALIDYVSSVAVVVSNDSGGGHLASLLGIPTFTITRRKKYFTWRPGFGGINTVVSPLFRIKWGGEYIWRPFVPVWKIIYGVAKLKSYRK